MIVSRAGSRFLLMFVGLFLASSLQLTLISGTGSSSNGLQVRTRISPSPDRIVPGKSFSTVTVLASENGTPLKDRAVKITLFAPESSFLTTDFPVVEGTRLLQLKGRLENGSFSFDYRFPIRGSYSLRATLLPADRGNEKSVQVEKKFHVSENPNDLRNASFLFLGLLGLGLLSGVIVRRTALKDPSSGSTTAMSLFGAFLLITGSTSLHAHGPEDHHNKNSTPDHPPAHVEKENLKLNVDTPDPDPSVGKPIRVKAHFKNTRTGTSPKTRYTLECTHEEGHLVFRMNTISKNGQLSQKIQFADGAQHRIRVRAQPVSSGDESQTLTAGKKVDVRAIQPPGLVVAKMMTILMVVFLIGLSGGYYGHYLWNPTSL